MLVERERAIVGLLGVDQHRVTPTATTPVERVIDQRGADSPSGDIGMHRKTLQEPESSGCSGDVVADDPVVRVDGHAMARAWCGRTGVEEGLAIEAPESVEREGVEGEDLGEVTGTCSTMVDSRGPCRGRRVDGAQVVAEEMQSLAFDEAVVEEHLTLGHAQGRSECDPMAALAGHVEDAEELVGGRWGSGHGSHQRDVVVAAPRADPETARDAEEGVETAHGWSRAYDGSTPGSGPQMVQAAPVASAPVIPDRLRPVLDRTVPLAEAFAAAGFSLALVGGVVRDLLLGRDMSDGRDIDLTTDALPADTKRLVKGWADSVWTQGERFGTIGCQRDGWTFEITTHRAEAYDPDSRKPEVRFSTEIEADLSRRDFTVNAMALSLPDPVLLDPFGGADDLVARRLRTPLSPTESFSDDPLRMLRAARFIAGYDLEPDTALRDAVTAMADRLSIVSAERVRDEFDKLMMVPDPTPGLWFLVDTGLIDQFLPEFSRMRLEQDPIHRHKDVLTHTIAVIGKTSQNRYVRLGALYHDVGKPRTRAIGDSGVSFHHHEVVGARMTRERMRALKYSSDDVEAVSRLVFLHLRFHTYKMGWTDSAVRRFVRDAGDLLPELIELTRCDCTTRNERRARELSQRMDDLEARIAELQANEELRAIRPDLDGTQVMARLGIEPGREVGEAMDFLLELRLDEGSLGAEEAGRRLDAWWAERSANAGG